MMVMLRNVFESYGWFLFAVLKWRRQLLGPSRPCCGKLEEAITGLGKTLPRPGTVRAACPTNRAGPWRLGCLAAWLLVTILVPRAGRSTALLRIRQVVRCKGSHSG